MADDSALPAPAAVATAAEFTRELQALRARSGLTIREVARAAKTPVATTGDYFSGRHLPLDRDQFARILAACGETEPARVEQWQAALARARRLPGRRTGTPYRGLARFEAEDARWFFGRDDVTELLALLAGAPSTLPLLLIGPSGAGKSSVLRAGLLPRLRAAGAVGPAADPADVQGQIVVCDLTVTSVGWLTARVAKLTAEAADDDSQSGRATVIVDQFEAVFTLCPDEGERRALIDGLCELARTGLVVLALRADFYQQAIRYPGLLRAAQERHVVLGPMNAEQVRRAVVEPARLARTEVADGLVEVLLADLAPAPDGGDSGEAHEPGALPLLSHALLAAWEHSHGGALTVADYLAGGGIKDALTRSAERAYESLSTAQQRLARRLFLRLVHVADDLPPSRAAVPLGELLSGIGAGADAGDADGRPADGRPADGRSGSDSGGVDAEEVLAVFIDERMITVDTGSARLTHDALLTAWPRLRGWIEESAEQLRTRRRIASAARAWAETGREEPALWRGSQLTVAREWADDPEKQAALLPLAGEFVAASIVAGTAREQLERRRTARLRSIVAVLTVLVVVVCLLAGYAFEQRENATAARNVALNAQQDANSREVAIESTQLRTLDPPLAAQLGASAYGIAHTPQATAALLESTDAAQATRIADSSGIVQAVAVSPNHQLLAAAGADGTLRLWNVGDPAHATPVGAPLEPANGDLPLYTVAFSPNGRVLAAAGAGRAVKLWDVSDPALPVPLGTPLTGAGNTIYAVAFSPDGRTLAAASADDTVRLWDVADPARARPLGHPLTGPTGYVQTVAFSADGRFLAAGSGNSVGGKHDDTVWVWNVTNPARPALLRGMPLTGPAALVSGVAFSPSGGLLAASSEDDKVWLWKLAAVRVSAKTGAKAGKAVTVQQWRPNGTFTTASNWVNTVAFSPSGGYLAAGTSEARVLIWNTGTRALTATMAFPQPVTTVAWDGNGQLAAADADGTASIWSLPSPLLLAGNQSAAVAYSPNGTTMAVGGTSLELWSTATRTLLATHPLPAATYVNGVAFSPGGGYLAVGYGNGNAQLLNARTLAPVSAPFQATARGAVETVAYDPDSYVIATGGDDGTVRTWSVANPSHPRQLASVPDSGDDVYTIAFAPDGKTLAAASIDDYTRLWNVTNPARPVRLGQPLGGLHGYAMGLAISPDSDLLAVGSQDGTVHLWDIIDPARPTAIGAPLTGPAGYIWATAFSPDGHTLAAGVTDGTVWLWNITDAARPSLTATLTGPTSHVYSIAFSPSGGQLAATSYDGTVHLWDTSVTVAAGAVCATLGQPLNPAEWATLVPGVPYRNPCG